jgi:hypothetical protein
LDENARENPDISPFRRFADIFFRLNDRKIERYGTHVSEIEVRIKMNERAAKIKDY